jgi:hypothetical protein
MAPSGIQDIAIVARHAPHRTAASAAGFTAARSRRRTVARRSPATPRLALLPAGTGLAPHEHGHARSIGGRAHNDRRPTPRPTSVRRNRQSRAGAGSLLEPRARRATSMRRQW